MEDDPAYIQFLHEDVLREGWEMGYGEGIELVNPSIGTRVHLFPDDEDPRYRVDKEGADGRIDERLDTALDILEENYGYSGSVHEVVL